MALGAGTSAACLAHGWLAKGTGADVSDSSIFLFGVQPMYPGLLVSTLLFGIGLLAGRRGRSHAEGE
jgi:hypothetical protein